MESGDNPFGADNQQERPGIDEWIVGFTDGEGCFSISVVRNRDCRLGWQVQHEFSVTQAAGSTEALELIREFFGCGTIIPNRRRDNHKDLMLRFSVKRRSDLVQVIVPFFTDKPLRTAKRADFTRFRAVLSIMEEGRHLESRGLAEIATITESMNRRRRSRYLESSEAIRRPSHIEIEMKIWSELRGDTEITSSEIPCRASSDLHEWRNDLGTVSTRDSVKLQCE